MSKAEGSKARVACILGPTASGKSELAVWLAERLDAEIVSADSMQVYRGMDIGTAKMPVGARRVPHHCIDILDPGMPCSAAIIQQEGRTAVDDILLRGKRAFVVGGTGFYVRAIIDELDFAPGEQVGNAVRDRYRALALEKGADYVWSVLEKVDPKSAALIHPNDTKRVIRALEMYEEQESYADRKQRFKSLPTHYNTAKIGLSVERNTLYERIDTRVDKMFNDGLVDEVEGLLRCGYRDALTAAHAIGYKELVAALDGLTSIEAAKDAIKQSTRRYAKRQMTWLRSVEDICWVDATDGIDDGVRAAAMAIVDERMDLA